LADLSYEADATFSPAEGDGELFDYRDVAVACAQLAYERKARDVKVYCVGDRLGISEYFVLATVNNRRQARAVRDEIRLGVKALGAGVPTTSSEDPEGRWSLYDYGGVVLHLFDDEGRQFFDLDALWEDVPTIDIEDEDPIRALSKPEPEPEPTSDFEQTED
jgi:ribosome-associated protein